MLHDNSHNSLCHTVYPLCSSLSLLIPYHSLSFLSSMVTAGLFPMSLFLFGIYIHLYYFLDSTYKWYQTVFVFVLLILLSIIFSRSIHVASDGRISFFLWLSSIPLHVCIYIHIYICTSLFIYLLMDTSVASIFWLL